MHKLVWFQLLLARKEGESENSQTPEPSLTTPAPPHHPPDTCIRPDFIAVFLLASLENLSNTGGTSGAPLILGV